MSKFPTAEIYALFDKRKPEEYFYIGQSYRARSRLSDHLKYNTPLPKELVGIQILEIVPQEDRMEREKYWIHHYSNLGHPLVNTVSNPAIVPPQKGKKYKNQPDHVEIVATDTVVEEKTTTPVSFKDLSDEGRNSFLQVIHYLRERRRNRQKQEVKA